MLNIILYFLILNTFTLTNSSNYDMVVYIENIESNQGQVIVSLYNDPESFPKKAYLKKTSAILNKNAYVRFNDIPEGTYAISVIHDKNRNNKIDFNFLHIPVERTAASNNATGFFGPPHFKDAKFELMKDRKIIIKFE